MSAQVIKLETERQKPKTFSEKIAEACGCTPRMVNYILSGGRGNRRVTALTEKVLLAVALYKDGESSLLGNIKNAVNQ